MSGVQSPDLPKQTLIDSLIGNRNGDTVLIDAAPLAAMLNGLIGPAYQTRALLYADLAWPAETRAQVYGDATTAYNGTYKKSGSSGSGSWSRIGDLPPSSVGLDQLLLKADQASLVAESTARQQADSSEAAARQQADANEQAARIAADIAIQAALSEDLATKIDAVSGANIGVFFSGSAEDSPGSEGAASLTARNFNMALVYSGVPLIVVSWVGTSTPPTVTIGGQAATRMHQATGSGGVAIYQGPTMTRGTYQVRVTPVNSINDMLVTLYATTGSIAQVLPRSLPFTSEGSVVGGIQTTNANLSALIGAGFDASVDIRSQDFAAAFSAQSEGDISYAGSDLVAAVELVSATALNAQLSAAFAEDLALRAAGENRLLFCGYADSSPGAASNPSMAPRNYTFTASGGTPLIVLDQLSTLADAVVTINGQPAELLVARNAANGISGRILVYRGSQFVSGPVSVQVTPGGSATDIGCAFYVTRGSVAGAELRAMPFRSAGQVIVSEMTANAAPGDVTALTLDAAVDIRTDDYGAVWSGSTTDLIKYAGNGFAVALEIMPEAQAITPPIVYPAEAPRLWPRQPAIPAWQAPAGWSSTDPLWDDVALQLDMAAMGMDQSEAQIWMDWAGTPAPVYDGVTAQFPTTGYLQTVDKLAFIGDNFTCEVFDLTPGVGAVVTAARGATIAWRIRWTGTAWAVDHFNGGALLTRTIAAAAPVGVDIALSVDAGTARFFVDGALLDTWAVGSTGGTQASISVGGDAVGGATSGPRLSVVRLTRGARHAAAYGPSRPARTAAKSLGGGRAIGHGIWTWFSAPTVLAFGGKILASTTTAQGYVLAYDPASHDSRHSHVATWGPGQDDHNVGAFAEMDDGSVLAVTTGHNDDHFYAGTIPVGADLSAVTWRDFGPELDGDDFSYSNLVHLEDEGVTYLVNRCRSNGWQIQISRSLDGGASFETLGNVFAFTGERPYLKVVKTSASRFDVFTTDQHPEIGLTGLYHCYYEGGRWHDSAGRVIGNLFGPMDFSGPTKLHDIADLPMNAWTVQIQKIGTRLVAFGAVYPENPPADTPAPGNWADYVRYTLDLNGQDAVWRSEFVCAQGFGFVGGAPIRYVGGIIAHPADADRVYASITRGGLGKAQIVEFHRRGPGDWEPVRQITDTDGQSIRPLVTTSPDMLLWCSGRYDSYTGYYGAVCALPI